MKRILTQSLLALTLTAGLSASALASDAPPEFTEEGLQLVENSQWGLVYVEPGATLEPYSKVQLLDTYVAFRKNWQRDHNRQGVNRVTTNDMDRIKERLATQFREVFTEVLEEAGYPVVTEAGEDVLLLRPAIINLDVNAPDANTAGRSRTFAESAGEMTIYLEIYDSVTGHLMAKGLDRQADRRNGFMQWQSRVQNTQAAKTILRGWAESIVQALDKAHGNDQDED